MTLLLYAASVNLQPRNTDSFTKKLLKFKRLQYEWQTEFPGTLRTTQYSEILFYERRGNILTTPAK